MIVFIYLFIDDDSIPVYGFMSGFKTVNQESIDNNSNSSAVELSEPVEKEHESNDENNSEEQKDDITPKENNDIKNIDIKEEKNDILDEGKSEDLTESGSPQRKSLKRKRFPSIFINYCLEEVSDNNYDSDISSSKKRKGSDDESEDIHSNKRNGRRKKRF